MLRRHANARLGALLAVAGWCVTFTARSQDAGGAAARDSILVSVTALFAAVEAADIAAIRLALAQLSGGHALTLDSVTQLIAAEHQIRYRLIEPSVAQSGASAIVRTRWERRSVVAGDSSAQLKGGTVSLVFVLAEGVWRLTSLSGDNPFERLVRR